MQVIATAHSL